LFIKSDNQITKTKSEIKTKSQESATEKLFPLKFL